jgi:LysR family transcriptional regulator, glycine cleavage system transcriptional activator
MSSRRLPPLNALRAFEATARHLSVKAAAEELSVTPGAVSQLIKSLERTLGVALFQRANRGIFLTEKGQSYLPAVRNAFRQIAEATRRITASSDTGVLTVSTTPSFAAAWLVPRLKHFQDAHPEIDLQITATKTLVDFSRDGVDVAIRHGLGRYAGLHSERIFAVELLAVAAPSMVSRLGAPKSPRELVRWPHVHDADRKDWHLWFEAQGIDDIGAPRGPAFDDPNLLRQAVLAEQGAGLLPAPLVANDLAAGRLLKLADIAWPEEFAYYLVYPAAFHERPKIAAFRAWITSVAACEKNDDGGSTGSRRNGRRTRQRMR